jgi:hypothetical protein
VAHSDIPDHAGVTRMALGEIRRTEHLGMFILILYEIFKGFDLMKSGQPSELP